MQNLSRFAAATALSLALVMPAGAMAQSRAACPANSTWTGTECSCNEGFTSVGGTRCVSASAVCGVNARLDGNRCACNAGFMSFKDECLSPSEFCAKTGAAFDASAGACVCPPQSARNIRTGMCESFPGATIRARLIQRLDVLAEVTNPLIVRESALILGNVLVDRATEAGGAPEGARIKLAITTVDDIFGGKKTVPELLKPVTPKLDAIQAQPVKLQALPISVPMLTLISPLPTAPAPKLVEVQKQIDANLLTLTQQISDLDALRLQQVEIEKPVPVPTPGTTPPPAPPTLAIKTQLDPVVKQIQVIGTGIATTKATLVELEPQKQDLIVKALPPTALPPPTTVKTAIATPTPLPAPKPIIAAPAPIQKPAPAPAPTTVAIKLPPISPTLVKILKP